MSDIRAEGAPALGRTADRAADARRVSSDASGLIIDLRTTREAVALPAFPTMEAVRPAHLPALRDLTARFDNYSDFDPTSLWGWSGSVPSGFRVATSNGNLVVEFADYLSGERFLSFIGDREVGDTATALLSHAEETHDVAVELRLVPQVAAEELDRRRFEVVEDPDAADYLYLSAEGAQMSGVRYKSLRSTRNSWGRRWGAQAELRWLDRAELLSQRDAILSLVRTWSAVRSGEPDTPHAPDADQEVRAFARLLETPTVWGDGLDGWSGVCMIAGELSAVFINEREGDRLSGHFLKVTDDAAGKGFLGWYFVELCRRAEAAGIRELNLQQDLGIPGLRAAKQQLRPSRMLRKYLVRRRA